MSPLTFDFAPKALRPYTEKGKGPARAINTRFSIDPGFGRGLSEVASAAVEGWIRYEFQPRMKFQHYSQ